MITDRTPADVRAGNAKGTYNYTDLNRVGAKMIEVGTLLGISIRAKTDWNETDIPTVSQMNSYIANLRYIQQTAVNAPAIPDTMDNLTYIGANNIEKMLVYAEGYVDRIINSYKYCGAANCGGAI